MSSEIAEIIPANEFRLDLKQWINILLKLEDHHGVFYKLWEMGMPVFTPRIETAGIAFNKGGDYVQFIFNAEFWQKCTEYERLFVICHEALHVILNHGVRQRDSQHPQIVNIAMDIVVNHMLLRCFGFDRNQIRNWEKLCWVDTVFKNVNHTMKKTIRDDECFEYYLNLLEKDAIKVCTKGKKGKGQPCQEQGDGEKNDEGLQTLDDHEIISGEENNWKDVIDRIDGSMSSEEKETIKREVDKHFQQSVSQKAGKETGGMWHVVKIGIVKKKQKWETVIKKWVKRQLRSTYDDQEQWARINRRMVMLPSNMFLPSSMEIEEEVKDKNKINLRFYLDTSGSCWSLKDRFFTAAASIPTNRFDVKLLCFDTQVYETDLVGKKMYGGGGTAFNIIEQDIQRSVQAGNKYPDAVFLMTDGFGNRVTPEKPERWFWFIDGNMDEKTLFASYCPTACSVFKLSDFE